MKIEKASELFYFRKILKLVELDLFVLKEFSSNLSLVWK
jgi:hypothetical protein